MRPRAKTPSLKMLGVLFWAERALSDRLLDDSGNLRKRI